MRTQIFIFVSLSAFALNCASQKLKYPKTAKVDQVNNYFGVEVRDEYQWLERRHFRRHGKMG